MSADMRAMLAFIVGLAVCIMTLILGLCAYNGGKSLSHPTAVAIVGLLSIPITVWGDSIAAIINEVCSWVLKLFKKGGGE
jgi:hypothetical protein